MIKVTTSNEDKPDFIPFTLNMRITSKESAHNLYKLLEPIIYARPDGKAVPITLDNVNKEQRQMAENICQMLSNTVSNLTSSEETNPLINIVKEENLIFSKPKNFREV